jgi:hypothetical protein
MIAATFGFGPGVGSEEITMCEHNGYFTSDFDSTSIVKLLDGVLTLE